MNAPISNIVSTQWLKQNIDNDKLIILDATMKQMPNGNLINQAPVYIPGAQAFNFDTEICDQNSALPHMLPSVKEFETAVRKLGINHHSLVVVYDAMGIFSSPRAWWMFKVMGHEKVMVLDGGLPQWLNEGFATQTEFSTSSKQGNFVAQFNSQMVFDAQQVLNSINDKNTNIIDARSKARFDAQEKEPRKGLVGGHIPGSYCLPFTELLNDGLFKNKAQMKTVFESLINQSNVINEHKNQLVFSCGSGVTASVLALAADECGYTNLAVYDGSWSEWGAREDLPVEK